ncbi:hypothetical protein BESB_060910 [Besnoitia besnoiti]|uniref:Transmembrane protein n=1 Tax=Besnoitia besnoiti TaxID=94643 RepID=A0A2A9MDC3_BESBE|nr:hypothetical protein BESB_060910 [Besnoitia besnoiti]PFH35204.1 hypothetical protein BESB_060910 [Besnoitia besnoiti]
MSAATGLRFALNEIRQFVSPWVPLTIVGVPCFANAYGMIMFKHHSFFNNKPNENVSRFEGEAKGGDH